MKRSEAARYARWSAGAALLLASLTAGIYLQRKWVEYREKRNAPAPAPRDVTKMTNGITFSKGEGTQKIFTVEASKMTDFKGKDASLLEDVKITVFGKTGARHDVIHTKSCQYEKMSGSIACSGEVQIDLESAADREHAARNPTPPAGQKVHVETREVTFNRASGTAHSDQLVKFSFPNGTGEAAGVEYDSEEGKVRLLRDVRMSLVPPKSEAAGKKGTKTGPEDPVHVTAKSLDFARDSRRMRLQGPVTAETSQARLVAGELTLALNPGFHAEKLMAAAGANGMKPELVIQQADGPANLSAETLTAYFAPEGWLTKMEGAGNVQGSRRSGKEQDEFKAENASLHLWPKVSQPKEMNLNGNVWIKTLAENTGSARLLQTSVLLVEFSEGARGQASELRRAETLGAGSIEWTDAASPSGAPGTATSNATARTKLQADKLSMEFGADGRAKQLIATGNVRTERAVADAPLQTATAQNGVAQLLAEGGWSQMDVQGNVKLKEGNRSGQADHAVFVRATQTAMLKGNAFARDGATETQAARITFSQASGEIRAEGGVRSTQFSSKGVAGGLGVGSGFHRVATRCESPERRRKRARRFPSIQRTAGRSGAGCASRNEKTAVVARDGGNAHLLRRREPCPPEKKRRRAIGGAKDSRSSDGFVFYGWRVCEFIRGRQADQPRGRYRRRHRRTRRAESDRRPRRIHRGRGKIRHERRKSHDLRRFPRHHDRPSIDLLFSG